MARVTLRRTWIAAALALLAVVGAYLAGDRLVLLRNLEAEALDQRFRLRGPIPPRPELAVVLIDDRTLLELGRLPIGREMFAGAIDRLAADGARVTALDVLMPEPGPGEADRALADAIRRATSMPTVVAFAFVDDHREEAARPVPEQLGRRAFRRVFAVDPSETPLPLDGFLAPIPEVAAAAGYAGHVTVLHDPDGGLRHELAALAYAGALYPSLPVAVAAAYLGIDWSDATIFSGREIRLGDHVIPLDPANRLPVNFLGPPGSVPTYSFVDVALGRTPPGEFAGKIVLIGGSALGIRDFYRSPFGEGLTGVERYATIVDNILSRSFIVKPAWARAIDLGVILGAGCLAALAAARLRPGRAAVVHALLLLAVYLGNFMALAGAGLWLDLLHPLLTIVVEASVVGTGCYVALEQARQSAESALDASRERYRRAVAGSNDGIWDWSLADGSFYGSPRLLEQMGCAADETLADVQSLLARINPDDRIRLERAVALHLAGHSAQVHEEFRLRDEPDAWRLFRGIALDGKRLAGSLTDISERRGQIQRFERLTRDLAEAKAEADRANQAKSVFLARMSHELRTPLNAVLGFSELMDKEVFGPIQPVRYAGYVADIHSSARYLLSLVTDVLDLSKLEAGGYALSESVVSFRVIAQEVVSLLAQQAAAKNLKLGVFARERSRVMADARSVRQILINLIGNAIKFTPAGGSIEIEIGVDGQKRPLMVVRDSGVGISVADVPRVTKAYTQIRAEADLAQAGTGLGLAIVSALVDLHGGTIEIESELGRGTAVTIRFPARRRVGTTT